MKTQLLKNGVVTLILTPGDEVERLLLQELFKDPAGLEIQSLEKIQVLNNALVDSVVISRSKGVNSSEVK